jgi:hypothetical protein
VPSAPDESIAVKNKFTQILSLVLWLEYPARWLDFFSHLFRLVDDVGVTGDGRCAALADPGAVLRVDMLLRVLLAIDRDIVSRRDGVGGADLQRINEIKDGMRAQCVERVINLAYEIILAYNEPVARQWRGAEQVVRQALQVLTRYVGWVDIEFVVGRGRAALLTSLLRVPEFRVEACAAIAMTVGKGMPASDKLLLISNLRLKAVVLEVLVEDDMTEGASAHAPLRKCRSDDEGRFLTSLGEIVNCMGVELCQSYDALRRTAAAAASPAGTADTHSQSAKEALDDLVQLLVTFLSSPDVAVSASVLGFCTEYVDKLKRTPTELSPRRLEHLRAILHVICIHLRYPDEYEHARAPDEFEQTFDAYRASLDVLAKNAAHLRPDFLADFINATLVQLAPDGAAPDCVTAQAYGDVECVVHLIFLALEGARDDSHAALAPFVPQWLERLMVGGVHRHAHRVVLRSFYDCCVRHWRALSALALPPNGASALMQVVEAMLDERGVRAAGADPLAHELRQRASQCFARLARSLRAQLVPFTDELLQICAPLLAVDINTAQSFSFGAQLSLYEALGTLVGATAQRGAVAAAVINSLLASIAALCSGGALRTGTATADIGCTVLAQHINVLASFCKAFQLVPRRRNSLTHSSVTSSAGLGESDGADSSGGGGGGGGEAERAMQDAYGALLVGAVDSVLAARVAASHSEEVRSATNTFLHCMVDTLGAILLTRLAAIVDASMNGATATSLVEFTRLLCQFIDRFGERVRDALEQLLLPLLDQLLAAVRATLEMAAASDASLVGSGSGGAGGGGGGAHSDASIEAAELRRAYYALLAAIAAKPALANMLRSSTVQAGLGGILSSLIDGLACDDDRASQKAAAVTLTNLIRRWSDAIDAPASDGAAVSAFGAFVWRQLVPAGIATAVRLFVAQQSRSRSSSAASAASAIVPSSTTLDAAAVLAVQEIASQHLLLAQLHGTAALSAIGQSAVELGCAVELVSQYVTSLAGALSGAIDVQTQRRMLAMFAEATARQRE